MRMKILRRALPVLAVTIFASGCASFKAPAYAPDYESVDRLKTASLQKMSVGEVQPRDPGAAVNKITLRGSTLSPESGTFAHYLEDAIRSDLKEMGVYDSESKTRIDATILKNDIDVSGLSVGYGVMDVKLTVSKRGALVFDKVYSANTQFESSFAGAVAIPRGQSEYPNLVRTLLRNVYTDPAFIDAVKQ